MTQKHWLPLIKDFYKEKCSTKKSWLLILCMFLYSYKLQYALAITYYKNKLVPIDISVPSAPQLLIC